MSRVGKLPIALPSGVTMTANDSEITIAGSKGTVGALNNLSTPTINALRRGHLVDVRRIGEDIRLDVEV